MSKILKKFSFFIITLLAITNSVFATTKTIEGANITGFGSGTNYTSGSYNAGDGITISSNSGFSTTQFRVAKSKTLTISISDGTITQVKIIVSTTGYKLNTSSAPILSYSGTTGTYNSSGESSITFTNSSANIARITQIVIEYTTGGGSTPQPSVLPVYRDTTNLSTVCDTIDGRSAGTYVIQTNVTITSTDTTIHYAKQVVEHCEPTIIPPTPSDDCTTSIDFESAASTYSDWTFSNITSQGSYSSYSSHGGSYFGRVASGTAYIVTKDAISNLQSIKFYVSKQTSNTTASYWKIYVSNGSTNTNPSTWTLVKSVSATSMTAGSWDEVTADLSTYYSSANKVAIYYTGSTAVRYIDDVCLSYVTDPTLTTNGITEITTTNGNSTSKSGTAVVKFYSEVSTLTATSSNPNFTVSYDGLNYTVTYNPTTTSCSETTTITLNYGSLSTTTSVNGSTSYTAPSVTYTPTDVSVTLNWTSVPNATSYKIIFDGTTYNTSNTTYTINGLNANSSYSYTVTPIIGSLTCISSANGNVETLTCTNYPKDITFESTIDEIRLSWTLSDNCNAYLYSDNKCTVEISHKNNVNNGCEFNGLDAGKTYYAVVYGDGTCPSDVIEITTQSPYITIVNWFPDSIHVDLNTATAATIQLEKEVTSNDGVKNIADGLFISKYFEASRSVKLVAIYNGTEDYIDLTDLSIIRMNGSGEWYAPGNASITPLASYGHEITGKIAPNEEIIVMAEPQNTSGGLGIINCIKGAYPDEYDNWYKNNNITFGGDKPVALAKNVSGSWQLLDVVGAITSEGKPSSQGTVGYVGNHTWGDDKGWYCSEGQSIDGDVIGLSTNRCLLIRKSSVKSGLNAVASNVGNFNTLCSEWVGAHVPQKDADGNDIADDATCENFGYVGTFNYQNYYSSFDSVSTTPIESENRNPDGTYTISIPELDTLSCHNIKVISKDASGNALAEEQQRVPIMVTTNMDVDNTIFTKFTVDTCKICDVVIENNSTLTTLPSPQRPKFKNVTVYAGSTLNVPSGTTHSINSLILRSEGDVVPYAVLNNTLTSNVKVVYFTKRITSDRYYFFSLPYDCKISDIHFTNGEKLVYGNDWVIKYYDGAQRAADNNSSVSHWKDMPSNGTLKCGVGYSIGVSTEEAGWKREIVFPMAISSTDIYSTDIIEKSVNVYAYGSVDGSYPEFTKDGLHANSVGWNMIGNPYLSTFGELESSTARTGKVILKAGEGWYDGFDDNARLYYTIPNANQDQTYYQDFSSLHNLTPFQATFIQAACDGTIVFAQSNVRRIMSRNVDHDYDIIVRLNLNNGVSEDYTTIILGDYIDEYEVGYDLLKSATWYTDKPQLYSYQNGDKLAFNSISDSIAKQGIQLGTYIYNGHTNKFSLNYDVSTLNNIEHVYLYDNNELVADLLLEDYTFITDKQLYSNSRFVVSIVLKEVRDIPTTINNIIINNNIIYLNEFSTIYDVLGRVLYNNKIGSIYLPSGIYLIVNKNGSKKIVI